MPDIYIKAGMGLDYLDPEQYNAVDEDLWWIRNIDSEPLLMKGSQLK